MRLIVQKPVVPPLRDRVRMDAHPNPPARVHGVSCNGMATGFLQNACTLEKSQKKRRYRSAVSSTVIGDQPNAFAASTTCSTVKPKCGSSCSIGALAP